MEKKASFKVSFFSFIDLVPIMRNACLNVPIIILICFRNETGVSLVVPMDNWCCVGELVSS